MSSIAIINVDYNYSVMPKFGASLTDDSRGVIHDRNVFINTGHWWNTPAFIPTVSDEEEKG
jgi:hypothetical protein